MHILTFDIEEWYHLYNRPNKALFGKIRASHLSLEKETNKIFDLLEEKKMKATFFWVGEEAQRYPSLLRGLKDSGHEIGVHSFSHARIGKTDLKVFKTNTERSIKTIEDIIGDKVKSYRAPVFSLTRKNTWALEVLKEIGIEYDSSLVTGSRLGGHLIPSSPYVIRNGDMVIKEFPVSSFSVLGLNYKYGGSGFFRVAPYKFLNPKLITSPYLMSYFHPRDFDKSIHQKIKLNPYLKLKYRIGAQRAFRNLDNLSNDISWISIREAANKVNWDNTTVNEFE